MTKSIVIQPQESRRLFGGTGQILAEPFSMPWSSRGNDRFEIYINNGNDGAEGFVLLQVDNAVFSCGGENVRFSVFNTNLFFLKEDFFAKSEGINLEENIFLKYDSILDLYNRERFSCFITLPSSSSVDKTELVNAIKGIKNSKIIETMEFIAFKIPVIDLPGCRIDKNGINVSEGYYRDALCGGIVEIFEIAQRFIIWVENPQKEVVFAAYFDQGDFKEYWPLEGE